MIPLQQIQNTRAASVEPDWKALMPKHTPESSQMASEALMLVLGWCATPSSKSRLTPPQQASTKLLAVLWVLKRSWFQGQSQIEVAARLGITHSAFRISITEARRVLGLERL